MRILILLLCFSLASCGMVGAQSCQYTNPDGSCAGVWITPPYDASNFTGDGTLVWTDTNSQRNTLRYMLVGKTMTVIFNLWDTSVSGNGYMLKMKIPAGKRTAMDYDVPNFMTEPGYFGVGITGLTVGDDYIAFYYISTPQNRHPFAQSNRQTQINGIITFEIQ